MDSGTRSGIDSERMWWFCLRHQAVEPAAGCANRHRMGPYATREEAAGALDLAAKRNEDWRHGGPDDDDDGDG
jgi:hypothetical protein